LKDKVESIFEHGKDSFDLLRRESSEDIKLDSDSAKNSQRNSFVNVSSDNEGENEYHSSLDGWDEDPYKEEIMNKMLDLNISVL
jgi:hypothetical protein